MKMQHVGPHIRTPQTTRGIMFDVLIALIPCIVAGTIFFGWNAFLTILLATVSAMITEALVVHKKITIKTLLGDGSAAITGILLALTLSPTVSWWIPIVGSVSGLLLGKHLFGGLGNNVFNPALVGRAILLLAWPIEKTRWITAFDGVTTATPLFTKNAALSDLFWGNVPGSLGETSAFAILLGAAYLIYKRHLDWRIPSAYIGTVVVFAALNGLNPLYQVLAGGLLLGAFFMATDMVTSPVTRLGRMVFGVGCGLLTMVARQYTVYPEGVTLAILLMNGAVPFIDQVTRGWKFGEVPVRTPNWKIVTISLVILLIAAGAITGVYRVNEFYESNYVHLARSKHLQRLFPEADYFSAVPSNPRIYLGFDGDRQVGAVVEVSSRGFNGFIDMLVVLNQQKEIKHIEILNHKEDATLGARIINLTFLQQMIGLKNVEDVKTKTIEPISGATISSKAVLRGVEDALTMYAEYSTQHVDVQLYQDGVYQASGEGYNGVMLLEARVEGGKIVDLQLLEHQETDMIIEFALPELIANTLETQSADFALVSGASYSSKGFQEALQNIIQQAKGGE